MVKRITIQLPGYLKKFYMYEYSGSRSGKGERERDEIHVDKTSELGKLIHLISRPIPFTQHYQRPTGEGLLSVRYYVREKIYDIPVEKLPQLVTQMEEIFRRTIICEVRGGHDLCSGDYGPLVAIALERRGIVRDVDIDYQTVRKIYRDYIGRIAKINGKTFA